MKLSNDPKDTTVLHCHGQPVCSPDPDLRGWKVNSNVGRIPTSTYHQDRIECHFWDYVEFVVNGNEYAD